MFNPDLECTRIDRLQAQNPRCGHCRVSTVNFDAQGPNAHSAKETEHLNNNVSHIQSTDWALAQFDYHDALRRRDETREVIAAGTGGNNGYGMQGGHC
ncbi:MAG TPA: hypothetical protein VM940_05465 [Chthoniobacterales bacterium]|jgi:hypothetical protein|nr:hypothetical protein [Chthoniobacterales bacterium]